MTAATGPPSVSGVVLAAGSSRRLGAGRPKQLLELDGEALLRRVVRTALEARLREVVVVLGHAAQEISPVLHGLPARRVVNPDYRQGQSTSVRAGLARIAAEASAALFLPTDQPYLTSALIDRLVGAYEATGGPIVAPTQDGQWRAPVLFDRSLFSELRNLEGDTGGRAVMPRYATSIVAVPVDDPLQLADVDTMADWRRLTRAPE